MKYIVFILFVLFQTWIFLPSASATGICVGFTPIYGRLDDTTLSKQSIQTGEKITITGNITSMTPKNISGWFAVHSSPGSFGRWEMTNGSFKDVVNIPAFSIIPYSLTVEALQPGIYNLSPIVHVVGTNSFLSMLNGCNKEPIITVTGNQICIPGFIPIIKTEDGSPVCVKSTTAQILVERGWGHSP